MRISLERSILIVAEQFLLELIKKYGKNPVSTDSGMYGSGSGGGTWYPQACRFLKLRHQSLTHSYYYEKSIIIERTIQYIKKMELKCLMIIFMSKR